MTHDESTSAGWSRRHLLAGLGAAGAAGVLGARSVEAASSSATAAFPQVLATPTAGLTYAQIDAVGFSVDNNQRYFDDTSGTGDASAPGSLLAALPVPTGSVIREISVSYFGQPTIQIWRRYLATPKLGQVNGPQSFVNFTLPAHNAVPRSETITAGLPLVVEPNATYSIRVSVQAGYSIFGMTIGYEPPKQGFVPLAVPGRPLDTRKAGGKLGIDEERTVNLDLPAGSRGAVLNLTITETEGTFGYVSVFAADIAYPNNSSINWSGPNQTLANAVITDVDGSGQIKIRGSVNKTHVIIDVLGAFQ